MSDREGRTAEPKLVILEREERDEAELEPCSLEVNDDPISAIDRRWQTARLQLCKRIRRRCDNCRVDAACQVSESEQCSILS